MLSFYENNGYFTLIDILICIFDFVLGNSLECYVCTNQDQNHEKCLNTIKTCEPEEDMCLSEISWGCEDI